MIRNQRFPVVLVLILLLAACATTQTGVSPTVIDAGKPADSEAEPTLTLPERSTRERLQTPASGAVDQLLQEADSALKSRDFQRASALIERAVRVAPADARTYFSLAQLRVLEQQPAQAVPLLQKARALAGDNRELLLSIDGFERRNAQLLN
jgi:tetratricopeptide (TPR) repeat protein